MINLNIDLLHQTQSEIVKQLDKQRKQCQRHGHPIRGAPKTSGVVGLVNLGNTCFSLFPLVVIEKVSNSISAPNAIPTYTAVVLCQKCLYSLNSDD